jgi:hypothetical protein
VGNEENKVKVVQREKLVDLVFLAPRVTMHQFK